MSGLGQTFLQQLLVVLLLALGAQRSLLLIADGARWIRAFFTETLAHIPNKTMILDWYNLLDRRPAAEGARNAMELGDE
jgi:hypothetical protein